MQLLREGAGRGPTVAHCHWAGPDTLLALFSDATTQVEQTLVNHGEHEVALRYRAALQDALEDDMKAEVERITGRSVTAVLSTARFEPDVMAEIFLLEPAEPGAAEAGPRGAGVMPAPRPGPGRAAGASRIDGAGSFTGAR